MHPLLHLAATQPHLLADHAAAYAELVSAEIGDASSLWTKRLLLAAVAVCCGAAATVLVGVAVMLWAVVPPAHVQAPWALFVTPLVPVIIAIGCLLGARERGDRGVFDNVRRQMKADMDMLREVSAP